MSNITLVLNTKDEAENIRAVFNCFSSVVDEIIVVDCESTAGQGNWQGNWEQEFIILVNVQGTGR